MKLSRKHKRALSNAMPYIQGFAEAVAYVAVAAAVIAVIYTGVVVPSLAR